MTLLSFKESTVFHMHCIDETHRKLLYDFTSIVSLTLGIKIFNYKPEWIFVTEKMKGNLNKSYASNQRKCNFWNLESLLGKADFASRLLELKNPLDEEGKRNVWRLCSSNKNIRLIMRSNHLHIFLYQCQYQNSCIGCSHFFFLVFFFLEKLGIFSISSLLTSSIYWISHRLLLIPEAMKILHKQLCGIVTGKIDLC